MIKLVWLVRSYWLVFITASLTWFLPARHLRHFINVTVVMLFFLSIEWAVAIELPDSVWICIVHIFSVYYFTGLYIAFGQYWPLFNIKWIFFIYIFDDAWNNYKRLLIPHFLSSLLHCITSNIICFLFS